MSDSSSTPPSPSFEGLKADVDKFTSAYDWNSATLIIEKFIAKNQNSVDKKIFELLAECYYYLSFQQKSRDDFKQIILKAERAYEKVEDSRCRARAAFCKHYASDSPEERKRILVEECLPLARESITAADVKTLRKDYAEFLEYLTLSCELASEQKQVQKLVQETKRILENAIHLLPAGSEDRNSISILSACSEFFCFVSGLLLAHEESSRLGGEITGALENLYKIDDNQRDARSIALTYGALGMMTGEFKGDWVNSASIILRALNAAEETRDNSLTGKLGAEYAHSQFWKELMLPIEDATQRKEFLEEALKYIERAIDNLKIAIEPHEINLAFWKASECLWNLARDTEQLDKKFGYLDKGIEMGRQWLSLYSDFCPTANQHLSDLFAYKAKLANDTDERADLLHEAIRITEKKLQQMQTLGEQDSFNVGMYLSYLGQLKFALSEERSNTQEQIGLMKQSISDIKRGLEISGKEAEKPALKLVIAKNFEDLGDILVKLYGLSRASEDCVEAIKAYDEAVDIYSKQEDFGLAAPISWKIAKLYDTIQEYELATETFSKAATQYAEAVKSRRGLQKSFDELSIYMQVWSKIEEARAFHRDEEYLSSSQKLHEVSSLLQKTSSFQFLSKHYEAYAKTEESEDFSRKEKSDDAAISFGVAANLFADASKAALESGKGEGEARKSAELSRTREKYCIARKSLEEAKVLDRNAQTLASMRKYRSASDLLRQLQSDEKTEDARDLDALALSCDGWATMKEAELKTSPELYSKASDVFLKAKENNIKQSFVLSCLANSSICRAFEAGTKFSESGDVQLYSEIKSRLGAASRYYEQARFEMASEWTRATEALFDALAYLAGAEREIDPQKKTQMYHLAEKHLELSARRYGDIGFEKKRTEVLKHLKTATENRELLITPIEALSQSPTVSATPVNFTRDQAVGLERFEVANISGTISLSTESVSVDSPIRIDVDIANVGKSPALLVKIDNLAPSSGFDIESNSNSNNYQNFHVDGNSISLDLKGKRLEYLKSQEISLSLIAKNRGNFQVRPRILFVDELGKYRSYEFEPQSIRVISTERKLAAIMFTDMAGYTALGQRNESLSIALVNEQRTLLRPIFKRHNGREVKTIGDAFLVEFASSLDAARCAYDIQRATREFNISLPEDKRIILRVGVHVGDIIESDDGDISGDAVNVASRVEPLAEHGGVCLTRKVYDNIQNKLDLKFESLGYKSLKNVSAEIEVFKMIMPWHDS
ncbi:MAG TPA: adenylate/guanylate cyclase domain-containing protein [Nitrososphaerales archaeon]|nr:adenylate/guanylate cyclase domain-containing protein [Nitrososphaerales archaeon]